MPKNIFKNIPEQLPEELFETLLKRGQVHIERIVSKGHATAEGYWYDQDCDEWVLLLQGQAIIDFENQPSLRLSAGDYLLIPAHSRHRVAWTADNEDTVWLAVHLLAENS
ncbi:MAG: cupin domain-containing protein [Methylovulum sp.]|uniref:cupin domain-containing protein n=1 Tax=Methylovulum sp. TaxID=1916980 RepID=UPI00261BC6BD|nr:cupin domain-containing protein [Methylovulum sp.]MDD2723788.1 cupin domain-containing protein [Methylovulum sp.]MDD5123645.1 cupin domain-containing protein [Methylovulum sp.]